MLAEAMKRRPIESRRDRGRKGQNLPVAERKTIGQQCRALAGSSLPSGVLSWNGDESQ